METLKKFKGWIIGLSVFLAALGSIAASPYMVVFSGQFDNHMSQEQKQHEDKGDRDRLARLELEKRLTQSEIRHAKSEDNQEDLTELREALTAINKEIRELKKKLGL